MLHALEQALQGISVPLLNLREAELVYLDDLLQHYSYWENHYTPLAGIAEVRAAVKDGPRLDLPMPFIPREFETLVEHSRKVSKTQLPVHTICAIMTV